MRTEWDSRLAFILASIGSAIGLGNIWRFPYICYKYGGGAFLIPYIVALFTAGIPLMILEFAIGHKMKAGAPLAFAKSGKNKEWIGWFTLLIAFGIVSYYAVIMGWCCNYFAYSFKLSWGKATEDFFMNKFLSISNSPFKIGKIKLVIVIGLLVTWISIIGCIWKGVKTVGKVIYVTCTLPWILLIIFIIRGLTLPGAIEGLKYYLTPNFSALQNVEVWRNGYAQVFFSLSVGFGVMITYASYLPEKSDIVNNAFIVALADAGYSFLAGFVVFATLGYYSYVQNIPVPEVVKASIPLAFITYPTIINLLPFASKVFGALFFGMLFFLGIDSAFSLVEAGADGIMEKWKFKKRYAINIVFGIIAVMAGTIYTTRAGLFWIDIVDYFMSNFGLIAVGIIECIALGYMFKLRILREHCNNLSEVKLGKWWDICIKFITPVILIWILGLTIVERIKTPYEGYSRKAEFLGGWLLLGVFFIIAVILMKAKGEKNDS
ncbi:MAG: sodium-dependent transporter [bacterium]|nr:sodium-dependent transporter [bacterium]